MNIDISFKTEQEIDDCPLCGSDEVSLTFQGIDNEIKYMQVYCCSCNAAGPIALGEDYDEEIHGDSFESYMANEAIVWWNNINIKK